MESEEVFDVNFGHLYQRWEAFVKHLSQVFTNGLWKNQADVFQHCMIALVHELAHLGSPPEKFTNNPNKSTDRVGKWTDVKKSPGLV